MPRLNPRLASTVFFLFGRNPQTGEIFGPVGTGVLIGMPGDWGPMLIQHVYAVTARHVLAEHGCIIRINTRDGGHRLLETEPDQWEYDEKGSDVAAYDVTSQLSKQTDDVWVIGNGDTVTKEFIDETKFGIGEDGFMLGLFSDLPGKSRNMVAARFGNVSLLAHDNEPIRQPNGNTRPMHLFDMHSRPGTSGAPVFAYRTPSADLRHAMFRGLHEEMQRSQRRQGTFRGDDRREAEQNTFLVLLGIHVAQYHDVVVAMKAEGKRMASESDAIRDGDRLNIPNSVASLVPIWDVLTLLERPKLAEQRRIRNARHAMEREKSISSRPDSAGSG